MIRLMRKAFQEEDGTWFSIKAGAFKSSRGCMIKMIHRHLLSYKRLPLQRIKQLSQVGSITTRAVLCCLEYSHSSCFWYGLYVG